MKILLVDDIDDSRDVLRTMIVKLGHQVIEATNGKEAVRVALDHKPDLVLMDLSMPVADGLQATAAIRTMAQSPRQLPIIAITAFPETLSEEKAFKAGCDGYLQKPIDMDALAGALKRFSPRTT